MARVTTDQRVQTIALLVLAACAGGVAMYWLKPVMVPFVIAVFIMLGINPVVDFICSRVTRLPRWVALTAVFLLILGLFPLAGAVISSSVAEFASKATLYQQEIIRLTAETMSKLPFGGVTEAQIEESMSSIPIGTYLVNFTNGLLGVLSNAVLVIVFLLFLLIGSMRRTEPHHVPEFWTKITDKIQRYIVTKTAVSAVTGLLVGSILWLLGVPLAGLFGFLTFILNFIPSVGSIIATLLPIPVMLVNPESTWLSIILAIAVPGSIQFTIGNVLEPKVLGVSLDLHPVVVILGLIFWGTLWGIPGMILAAPIVAIVKILLEQYELTRPVAMLMAGKLGEIADAIAVDPPTPMEPSEVPHEILDESAKVDVEEAAQGRPQH